MVRLQRIEVGTGDANIDHLVIGPGGVVTVNTKNLGGKVWVAPRALLHNGRKTNYLPKAAREAERAGALVGAALGQQADVRGALAIIADELVVEEQPADVFVATPRGVKRWLLGLPLTFAPQKVREVCSAAAKPSTWSTSGRRRDCR